MKNSLTKLCPDILDPHSQLATTASQMDICDANQQKVTSSRLLMWVKELQNNLRKLSKFYVNLCKDLKHFAEFPNQIAKAVLELPAYYQSIINENDEKWMKKMEAKDRQISALQQNLGKKCQQIERLKRNLMPLVISKEDSQQTNMFPCVKEFKDSDSFVYRCTKLDEQKLNSSDGSCSSPQIRLLQNSSLMCLMQKISSFKGSELTENHMHKGNINRQSPLQSLSSKFHTQSLKRNSKQSKPKSTHKKKSNIKENTNPMDKFWCGLEEQISAVQDRENQRGNLSKNKQNAKYGICVKKDKNLMTALGNEEFRKVLSSEKHSSIRWG